LCKILEPEALKSSYPALFTFSYPTQPQIRRLLIFVTKISPTRPGISSQDPFRKKKCRRLYSAADDIHYVLRRGETFSAVPILLLLWKQKLAHLAQKASEATKVKRVCAFGKISTEQSGIPAITLPQRVRGDTFLAFNFFRFQIAQNNHVSK